MTPVTAMVPTTVGSADWWRERLERDERRRPRADGLTLERIVAAAVELVDAQGLDALTVRRLASGLGTGSASLYRHVASREELLVLMIDHVLGEITLPPESLTGRERVVGLAAELRRVLMAHPRLLPALAASPLLGPNAMRGAERGMLDMHEVGFDPIAAVPAYLALIDYVLGTVYFDTSSAGQDFRSVADFEAPSAEEVFEFGLETFLAGLDARFPSQ